MIVTFYEQLPQRLLCKSHEKNISNLKMFALLDAEELAQPIRENSASAPQRIQNTASGKESK